MDPMLNQGLLEGTSLDIEILVADYSNSVHATDIVELLNGYALDPMGGGAALSDHVQKNLPTELAKLPNAFSVLCYVDGVGAGLVNCFVGFSTFKCKPLINIHDVIVAKQFRGHGLSHRMLDEVQRVGKERGCCRLTLEVLERNEVAKKAYLSFGFEADQAQQENAASHFWQKNL